MSGYKTNATSVPVNKENSQELNNEKKGKNATRNPLSDVCGNVISQKKERMIQKSTLTALHGAEEKTRCASTSKVEKKVNYYFKSKTLSERKLIRQVNVDEEEVSESEEEHYVSYVSQKKYVRIASARPKLRDAEVNIPAPHIKASSSAKAEIRRPPQKVNLVRRLSNRHKRCKLDELYSNCYYDADYFKDNYQYMLDMEGKFIFPRELLEKNVDEDYRRVVVNWLIYVQQILDLAEYTFFVGVRMFDFLLLRAKIPRNTYMLIGITCLWIANKNLDVHFIQASKLFSICNEKYSRREIIRMEKEILRALRFNVNFSEPSSFLYYYLKREQLENDPIIVYSTMFLLELFALMLDFSCLKPSLLASLALHIVLVKYKVDSTSFLDYVTSHLTDKNRFLLKSAQIEFNIKLLLLECKFTTHEIVEKYSTEDKFYIAHNFVSE